MNHTITTTLGENFFSFLDYESKRKIVTKKSIIEKWLEYYKKYELEKQVKEWFEKRKDEYKSINSDFWEVMFKSITN